ncbi:Chitobiosyldiphosphodolichol alpha-mannosyltransferase [Fasciola gigantica]|uniref:Chitobiosyldiphosphodolichol alpha-mannosyltransferase n=1 Tax=Fasciola gigantica TaxID=46835 RepID=A0A504YRL0_FASGI|nr:Chitobiosyldiphosphodolichol alpha-mannosyltransferase [Fasciola gigantica]
MLQTSVHVIVLGDVTRSPRILRQACYLANEGYTVTVSGYDASLSVAAKTKNMNGLDLVNIPDPKKYLFLSSLSLIVKFILHSFFFLFHLIQHCRSPVILVQSPPAVPTFLVLWIFTRITGKKLIIDWHNYGFTLLELTTTRGGFLPRVYQMLELSFASRFLSSNVEHLCVSRALQKNLLRWNINASVYYDRAPDDFASTPVDAAHELFTRLKTEYPALSDQVGSTRRTRFTEVITLPADCGGQITQWRTDRPALVLSSCSWTPDDDFTMMIEALDRYNERAEKSESELPHVVFAVTGRGPLKSYYEQLIREKCWTHVEVIMPWLTPEDYPVFLGCADVGISLHRSSSGLDLPMKVCCFSV